MKILRFLNDCVLCIPILMIGNILAIWSSWETSVVWKILLTVAGSIYYCVIHIRSYKKHSDTRKLATLAKGLQLMELCAITGVSEFFVYWYWIAAHKSAIGWLIGNGVLFAVLYCIMILDSLIRIGIGSGQLKWYWYLCMFLWWWVPVFNLFLFWKLYRIGARELKFERVKLELDSVRMEGEICRTRYPILLVHGIFFRDWQYLNYWGRIPAALKKNGAVLFYGKQQSAQSVVGSAQELAQQIQYVLKQTGAEKVNIIAHSKGGLDSRYAITHLGMAPYVATLTTINTPHHGCAFVDVLFDKLPQSLVNWLSAKYNTVFRRLGDQNPDFLGGVRDLTEKNCTAFQANCPPAPEVSYRCVMSKMHSTRSAPFPLWLGYLINRKHSGENDGLVPVESAKLESASFHMITHTGRRGISHGDMIDLMRENIPGFDVREFYVQLAADLKREGY